MKPKAMPKLRPAPAELIRVFERAMRFLPEAEPRKMFGYPCAFVSGNLFAGLHQENLMVRLSPEDRAIFLAIAGTKPFEPMPGRPMRDYVVAPANIVNSENELNVWLWKAFQYAQSLPPKVKKARSAKKAAP